MAMASTLISRKVPYHYSRVRNIFESSRTIKTSAPSRDENSVNDELILCSDIPGVRKIVFNRPTKCNALTKDMVKTLISSIEEGSADPGVKVIAVTGAGNYFTSGMDMSSLKKRDPSSIETIPNQETEKNVQKDKKPKPSFGFADFLSCFVDCRKPLIALVNGPAIGIGVTMLGLFDSVVASDSATFHARFTEFGLPPEAASTYTFPLIMGYARASNALLFSRKITAQQAYESGLVSRVFPSGSFQQETSAFLREIGGTSISGKSMEYTKELIRGRDRETLKNISKHEQSFFNLEIAKEVRRSFLLRKETK